MKQKRVTMPFYFTLFYPIFYEMTAAVLRDTGDKEMIMKCPKSTGLVRNVYCNQGDYLTYLHHSLIHHFLPYSLPYLRCGHGGAKLRRVRGWQRRVGWYKTSS